MAFEREPYQYRKRELYGRTVLYSSIEEENLNPETIIQVLKDVLPVHFLNMNDIEYLNWAYRGRQDILDKVKLVRPEINNKVVENSIWHIVEFKKGFAFGEPVQYVQDGDTYKEEVDLLNKYMKEIGKSGKDKDLAEDWYVCGTAYRMVFPRFGDANVPFDIFIPKPQNVFVVYDSGYEHKQILGGYITLKKDYAKNSYYYVITVYTNNNVFTFKTDSDKLENAKKMGFEYIPENDPIKEVNWLGYIPIIEYPLNKNRLGLVELILPSANTLNKIVSNDIDDIEQFVNALLVFTNADLDSEEYTKMLRLGAINVQSNADRGQEAKVDILTNKLQHTETKVLYDRIYNNMLTIAGVPRMTDKASSGDTGQARLVGEGWTMADERAKQDELSFIQAEKKMLAIVLEICRNNALSGITNLKLSDIEVKFNRNKNDNMMTKAQTLEFLKNCQVAPDYAFHTIGLWSDSNEVVNASKAFFGDDFWKQDKSNDNANGTQESNTEDVIAPAN